MYTLEVPLSGEGDLDLDDALAAVEALRPRQIELRDAPPAVLAWVDTPPVAFARPHTITPAPALDWDSAWGAALRPMRVGPLWIVPPGHDPPPGAALSVEIDARAAFGTGLHPTTALCLERLVDRPPDRPALDVGTGSGLLALAALALGAPSAHGTDHDPTALDAARDNARRNGLADRFTASADLPEGRFGWVLANILDHTLVELAPDLVRGLDRRGTLILSGIRAAEAAAVASRFRRLGLRLLGEERRDGWCCFELATSW